LHAAQFSLIVIVYFVVEILSRLKFCLCFGSNLLQEKKKKLVWINVLIWTLSCAETTRWCWYNNCGRLAKVEGKWSCKHFEITTYKHKYMFFNMDIPHSQLAAGSDFLSCWIHVVIFFLLLLSCLVFYVFGITCMLGRACLALILLWTTMIFFYCKWLLLNFMWCLKLFSLNLHPQTMQGNNSVKKIGNAVGCRLWGQGFLHENYAWQINILHGLSSNTANIFLKYFSVAFINLVSHLTTACGEDYWY